MAEWTLSEIVKFLESRCFHEDVGRMGVNWLQDDPAFVALKEIAEAEERDRTHLATDINDKMQEGLNGGNDGGKRD